MANDTPDWTSDSYYTDTFLGTVNLTAAGGGQTFNVAAYSSLTIILVAGTLGIPVSLIYRSSSGGNIGSDFMSAEAGQGYAITIPVDFGQLLVFTPVGGSVATVTVIGSNRPVSKRQFTGNGALPATLVANGPFTLNTPAALNVAGNGIGVTTFTGLCSYSAVSTTVAGRLWYRYASTNGAIITVPVAELTAGALYQFGLFVHPFTSCAWQFNPAASNAGGTVVVNITGQS